MAPSCRRRTRYRTISNRSRAGMRWSCAIPASTPMPKGSNSPCAVCFRKGSRSGFGPRWAAVACLAACLAAFVAWRMLPPHIVVPPGPGVQPIVTPQPVKPKADAPGGDARRALESTAGATGLKVTLGDSMDRVKSLYNITSEPFTSGQSLGFRLPLSGIYFFFTEADKTLENIRVDAPFEGSVEGVRIGDPVSGILSRLGEPYTNGPEY